MWLITTGTVSRDSGAVVWRSVIALSAPPVYWPGEEEPSGPAVSLVELSVVLNSCWGPQSRTWTQAIALRGFQKRRQPGTVSVKPTGWKKILFHHYNFFFVIIKWWKKLQSVRKHNVFLNFFFFLIFILQTGKQTKHCVQPSELCPQIKVSNLPTATGEQK